MAKNFSQLIPQEGIGLGLTIPGGSLCAVTRSSCSLPNGVLPGLKKSSGLERADDPTPSSPVLEDGLPDSDNLSGGAFANHNNEPFAAKKSAYLAFGSERSRLPADWLQILQENNRRYSLRDTDRHTFRGSGLQDLDKSGTYADEKPEKLARPPKPKTRKIAKVSILEDGDNGTQQPKLHQSKTLSYEQSRKSGKSMMLRLKFSSEEGLANFKAMTRKLSGPKAADKISDGYRRNVSDSAYGSSRSSLKDRNGATTRRSALNFEDTTPEHLSQNSESTYENLVGHREARGCRDCYDLRMECSLIHNCPSYPCDNCQDDDHDCILTTPRNKKQVCERCKHKKFPCSYNNDTDEDGISACDNCQDANVICLAGPAKSYRIDDVLASTRNKADKKRKPLVKKRSIKARAQPPSDTSRKFSSAKQGNESAKKKKVSERDRAQGIDSKFCRDLESSLSKFANSVPGGRILYITTSFAHPIQFNWIPPPPLPLSRYSLPQPSSQARTSSFPCHFCTDPGICYALTGLGSKRVQVIQWLHDHTAGYEELEGGWVHAREEGTRMCQQCTMQRTLICTCANHSIRPIKGLDPTDFDFEAAIRALVSQSANRGNLDQEQNVDVDAGAGAGTGGDAGAGEDASSVSGMALADIKWCTICLEPAFYECCTPPEFTSTGTAVAPTDDIGCGLLLCEVCAGRITEQRALAAAAAKPVQAVMTLHELISAAARDTFHYRDGLRADVCFLMEDSELMRRQGAGWGGEDGVGDGGRESGDGEKNGGGDGRGEWDEDRDRDRDREFRKGSWGMGSPIDLT